MLHCNFKERIKNILISVDQCNFKERIKNILISVDQLVYVLITLGTGNPDETCSSAAWRMECDGKFFWFFRPIIDGIFFFDTNHCKESYTTETRRKEFLKDLYNK